MASVEVKRLSDSWTTVMHCKTNKQARKLRFYIAKNLTSENFSITVVTDVPVTHRNETEMKQIASLNKNIKDNYE